MKRSKIVGLTELKNKVTRNAFDLSHRHMFTAQFGELLPIFTQWVNPNETFKLGYNGITRTAPLQTAAFTRLRENVQYYFVPFRSLWKYFEQQVNNMTTGQSGENIAKIAASATSPQKISTGMPYISFEWLQTSFGALVNPQIDSIVTLVTSNDNAYNIYKTDPNALYNYFYKQAKMYAVTATSDLTRRSTILDEYGRYRYAVIAKLLRALGYCQSDLETYDLFAKFYEYLQTTKSKSEVKAVSFNQSFGLAFNFNPFKLNNAPNLSIFPLLAYHKICQDHYKYRQWEAYDPTVCNIDYLKPSESMNFATQLSQYPFAISDLFYMEQSNLPLDYFLGVLPKAQYGEESAATIHTDTTTLYGKLDGSTDSVGLWSNTNSTRVAHQDGTIPTSTETVTVSTEGRLMSGNKTSYISNSGHVHGLKTVNTFTVLNDGGNNIVDGSLKISALRTAIALQKYKEIQNSNDSDYASQVLAHFGIKPQCSNDSLYIGGSDSTIDINPQVNQNLEGDNSADIKAIAVGNLSAGCKFTSKEHGIIIGIYRCTPQLDYAKVGIDRNLFKTDASDFPLPELDRVGMQTQYRCELYSPKVATATQNYISGSFPYDMAKTYGYLPRYAELKVSYDRYEGGFLGAYNSWVTGLTQDSLLNWLQVQSSGNYYYPEISSLMKCDPHLLDSIFLNQRCLNCNDDKLLIGSVNTCVAVRPFSVYGLPYSK